jgi:hypothetical protein
MRLFEKSKEINVSSDIRSGGFSSPIKERRINELDKRFQDENLVRKTM